MQDQSPKSPTRRSATEGAGRLGIARGADRKARIAVLVPCYNEERTIAKVIAEFRGALPDALVYVYDNASTDATSAAARGAGAIVVHEPRRGKGNVVRRMFADIDADIYVLVDGDDTYDAAAAPELVRRLISERLDMVNGARVSDKAGAYRFGHRTGNWLFSTIIAKAFGQTFTDVLSGYRVLSHRFVKSFPAMSGGFEIETEMTVHALDLGLPVGEHPTAYDERPVGSTSKLNTYRDGLRILWTILVLMKEERPLPVFGALFVLLAAASLGLAAPVLVDYWQTGLVPRLPTAVLASGMMVLAFLSLACGLILDTVTRGRRELKRMLYLSMPALGEDPPEDEPRP